MTDRRKTKEPGPPPPLLLLPASQSLTFSRDEEASVMPGILMPVPLQLPTRDTTCEFDQGTQYADDGNTSGHLLNSDTSHQLLSSSENLKASKSWNSFQILDKPEHAFTTSSGASVLRPVELPQSSSSSFLPSDYAASSAFYPGAMTGNAKTSSVSATSLETASVPPSSEFIPAGSLLKSHQSQSIPQSSGTGQVKYVPVTYHWFFCKHRELRQLWEPFSFADSVNLEDAFRSGVSKEGECIISTDGGRYDVGISSRTRRAAYWDEPDSKVRRCSWFYRQDGDSRLVPYEEDFADKLEDMYKATLTAGDWHQKNELPNGDTIIFHSPTVIMHFCVPQSKSWNSTALSDPHPRVVKRGAEDLDNIYEGESTQIDHLVFIVHGIGPTCDLRFRNIIECVDDFRMVSHQMLASHFKHHLEEELIGRVEFLPVRWHAALHGDATGIDRKLKAITLNSIGKLRQFTNDTLIDVLFYGSPAYAQKIADTVGNEINRLHQLFLSRNPNFSGGVSVAGHSLGSLILFDLLVHQRVHETSELPKEEPPFVSSLDVGLTSFETATVSPVSSDDPPKNTKPTDDFFDEEISSQLTVNSVLAQLNLTDYAELFQREQVDLDSLVMLEDKDLKELGLPLGPRKKIFSFVNDLKSRKANKICPKVDLVTSSVLECEKALPVQFSSEIHDTGDSDPVLRSASSTSVNFVVGDAGTGIPFIRYPQLDFSPDNFFALGSPIAMFLTVRGVASLGEDFQLPTCPGFFNIFHPFDPVAYRVEPMVTTSFPVKPVLMPHHKGRKRFHLELRESLSRVGSDLKQKVIESVKSTWRTINDFALAHRTAPATSVLESATEKDEECLVSDAKDFDDTISMCSVMTEDEYPIGLLNQGRRVDYVLQEKPIESFNEYLFALSSHGCYWDSEDTVLLMLKEIYALLGITPQKPGHDSASVQHPPAAFPRHPLSQPLRPGYPAQVTAESLTPYGPIMPASDETLACSQPLDFGPPPMSGFIRK